MKTKKVIFIVIKTIFCILLFLGIKHSIDTYYIFLQNDLAIQNLNGGNYEYFNLVFFNRIKIFYPYGLGVLFLFIFKKEIKSIINYVKERI